MAKKLKIGVPKEIYPGEKRVAMVPDIVRQWVRKGCEIIVQSKAGKEALYEDSDYKDAGAKVVSSAREVYSKSDVVVKVQPPDKKEIRLMHKGQVLIGFIQPLYNPDIVKMLAEKGVTSFSMDAVPRITRAQYMDALSSQATVAGYKSVLIAANHITRFFPMLMTAAMTIRPAKVLVIGAGVAGLQAIATARKLGAVVKAIDVRPAVKEEVESLGASFVPMEVKHEEAEDKYGYAKELPEEYYRKEQEIISEHIKDVDAVITTAQIPGRKAPKLITENMVKQMKKGAIIIDLAVDTGGNCTLSKKGKFVEKYGVTIYGFSNAPSSLPSHASDMYSRNISNLLNEIVKDGEIKIDTENEILKEMLITHEGKIVYAKLANQK